MKRRILSLALALLRALACAAVPAAAAGIDDYPIFYSNVNGSRVMDLNSHPDADGYFPDFDVPGSDLYLQSIRTYHWNSGRGASPGLISIYDWDTDICYGEWAATGTDGNTWWVVYPDMPLEGGRMLFLTPMGPCTLRWGDGEMTLDAFDSVLVPAGLEGVTLEGDTKVLMSSLPDREKLIGELGYRAGNVAGLMD